VNKEPGAEETFKKIGEAYEVRGKAAGAAKVGQQQQMTHEQHAPLALGNKQMCLCCDHHVNGTNSVAWLNFTWDCHAAQVTCRLLRAPTQSQQVVTETANAVPTRTNMCTP
jgi:hypothetical protein